MLPSLGLGEDASVRNECHEPHLSRAHGMILPVGMLVSRDDDVFRIGESAQRLAGKLKARTSDEAGDG